MIKTDEKWGKKKKKKNESKIGVNDIHLNLYEIRQ